MSRVTARALKGALIIPLTAILSWLLVAALPLRTEGEAKNETLRSLQAQLEADLGLGQPLGFLRPWEKLFAGERLGDGGRSYTGAELVRALMGSLRIGMLALLLSLVGGLFYAWALSRARGQWIATSLRSLPPLIYALPTFVVALWVARSTGLAVDDTEAWRYEPIAALVLALGPAAFVGAVLAGALEEESTRPYLLAARARGLSPAQAWWRHALPNAGRAVLDALPPLATSLLAGSFVVEKLFHLPYFGYLYLDAAQHRQLALVVVATTLFAALLVSVSLVTDLLRAWWDPRTAAVEDAR